MSAALGHVKYSGFFKFISKRLESSSDVVDCLSVFEIVCISLLSEIASFLCLDWGSIDLLYGATCCFI